MTTNEQNRNIEMKNLDQGLPDTIVDGDKLRDLIADFGLGSTDLGKRIEALIPDPPPRTLADMSFEELKDYIGEDVMVDGWANPSILVAVREDEGAVLAHKWKNPWPSVEIRPLSYLTPVAASEQEAEDTPEPVQPLPEDVPAGEPWIVRYERKEWVGVRADEGGLPWSIVSMDGLNFRDVSDHFVTLVSRLVPDMKP